MSLICSDSDSESEDDMTGGAIVDNELKRYIENPKVPES